MKDTSRTNDPIMEFTSEEHLQNTIEEWKKILFLENWIIKGVLVEPPLYDDNGCELGGKNSMQMANRACVISIVTPDEDNTSRIAKYCAEKTLVHELLHCKYNWLQKDSYQLESVYFDVMEHALLEEMAKSLIMVKYNLPFKWFENF